MSVLLTRELVQRLTDVEFDYTRLRMEPLRKHGGPEAGVQFLREGGLRGLMASGVPNPYFNRILAAGQPDAAGLEAMMRAYDETGTRFDVEVMPGALDVTVAQTLAARGFQAQAYHPVLAGSAAALREHLIDATHDIRRVDGPEALAAFKDVYVDGWDVAEGFAKFMRTYIDQWATYPAWTLYLARIDGTPAAAAVVHRSGDVGYLADSTTAKAFRGRGCQKALLRARIRDAVKAGCQLVMSRAEFASVSQHNMEKIGMHVSYTRAVWSKT